MILFPAIEVYIQSLDIRKISEQRQLVLQPLLNQMLKKRSSREPIAIQFVCTHNSRRSHLTQIWAQTMAAYYSINSVYCYSGGTETTALYPTVLNILQEVGFTMSPIAHTDNPVYAIRYSSTAPPVVGFSKRYDNPFNAASNFIAVMTCADADENCPFIAGAEQRISMPYIDPKRSDRTPNEIKEYSECSEQIALEMKFIFSKIK